MLTQRKIVYCQYFMFTQNNGIFNRMLQFSNIARPRITLQLLIGFIVNLQSLSTMAEGRMMADMVAVIGSIDICLGEIDR